MMKQENKHHLHEDDLGINVRQSKCGSFSIAFCAFAIYGTWALIVNLDYGREYGLRAGLAQGLGSFFITLFLYYLVYFVSSIFSNRYVALMASSLLPNPFVQVLVYFFHVYLGTIFILEAMLPSIIVGQIFNVYVAYTFFALKHK